VRSHEKRRAKLALADEDCQYDGVDDDEARSLRKNYCGTVEIQWSPHLEQQENTVQDSRARQAGRAGWARRGGNPICPRRAFLACLALHASQSVALADFFSILLE